MFSNLKLKASMIGSLSAIIAVTTLALMLFLAIMDVSILLSFVIVVPFFLIQWYLAPTIVEKAYKVEEASREKYPRYHSAVERISKESGIEKPKTMIANIEMPNAFAYGNFKSGDRVAITKGLIKELDWEEVEAVIGHEIGHLKNRDSTYMTVLSILPALFFIVGRMFLFSSIFSGGGNSKGKLPLIAIAIISMIIYFALQLCIMHFSRMREYYADTHASKVVEDGNKKLGSGLVKINESMDRLKKKKKKSRAVSSSMYGHRRRGYSRGRRSPQAASGISTQSMRPLLITDPEVSASSSSDVEGRVSNYAEGEVSFGEKLAELCSTHPNIKKRLRALGYA